MLLALLGAGLATSGWGVATGRLGRSHSRRRRIAAAAILNMGAVAGLLGVLVLGTQQQPPAQPPRDRPPSSEPSDRVLHEVWPSSVENVPVELPRFGWAMTDFWVTQPYLRSIEAAVGPSQDPGDIEKVLLIVYDEHEQEIASGEAPIENYRAKFTFNDVKDLRDYVGKRLFLQVRNIYPGVRRVYMTRYDYNRKVTSYLHCDAAEAVDCPNPRPQDLSVLIVGRERR